jgi:hypothetical protein
MGAGGCSLPGTGTNLATLGTPLHLIKIDCRWARSLLRAGVWAMGCGLWAMPGYGPLGHDGLWASGLWLWAAGGGLTGPASEPPPGMGGRRKKITSDPTSCHSRLHPSPTVITPVLVSPPSSSQPTSSKARPGPVKISLQPPGHALPIPVFFF